MRLTTDFLVMGSGVAGLCFALRAAEFGKVLIVTKRRPDDSATNWAQGGVAAVIDPDDSFLKHIQDTHDAGAGLCHDVVVERCIEEGPGVLQWLMEMGAEFTRSESGELDLGREGGHSERRVVHSGDITGREIQRALLAAVRSNSNIELLDWHMGIDLLTEFEFGSPDSCVGAHVFDEKNGVVKTILARATILATGGAGKVYLYTSNPDVATGDGVAMAYRAGAEVGNMEFVQFHPTALYHPTEKNFLISEALRGEGAVLRRQNGEAFMTGHHPLADLAPRDIVARAIDAEMKKSGSDCVYLDITHKDPEFIKQRFPGIYGHCIGLGIDICKEWIPVVPAAHYMCGGVTTNLHGRSSLPGLWALGETAFTGLHGANRLASNSLLEGLVYGKRAAERLRDEIEELRKRPFPEVADWINGDAVASDEAVVVTHNWDELRRTMWNYVGIVRTDARLRRAEARIRMLQEEIDEYYWRNLVTRDLLELRNICTVASLAIACARSRKESRGLHFTIDYPETSEAERKDSIVKRGVKPFKRSF